MRWSILALIGVILLLAGCAEKPKFPGVNLILITVDTMRADYLASYGHPTVRTPHLDRLAAGGVLFAETFASVPLTLPSHTTFLTGLFPSRHGVHDNGAFRLADERTTVAEYLGEAGYRTAAFVSSFQLDKKYGLAQGFHEYDDKMPARFHIFDRRIASGPKAENVRTSAAQRRANEITDLTADWFERGGAEPFFLWLHYFDPHETYDPPPPFDGLYPNRPFPKNLYEGEITFLDHEIGKLIDMLEERGIYDRTLIFLSADHGEGLGEHRELYHDVFIYDSTLRIPFLVGGGAAPDGWPPVVDLPVRSVDIVPTLLDAAGIRPKKDVQGRSLLPLLDEGKRSGDWWNYCESWSPTHNQCSKLYGIRTEEWKYIDAPVPELYDIAGDPGETKNLADMRPGEARKLRDILREQLAKEEAERIEVDDETRERLAAIGYVHRAADDYERYGDDAKDPKDFAGCIDGLHRSTRFFLYGEHDSSLAVLQRLKDECPEQGQILDNIGNLQIRLGKYDEAIADFTEITTRYPRFAKGYFYVGMGHLRRERPEDALMWFRSAIRVDPNLQIAHYNIGLAYLKMRKFPEAIEAWEETFRINPGSLTGRMTRKALDNLNAAVNQSGGDPDVVTD